MTLRLLSAIALALVLPISAHAQEHSFDGLWRADPATACVHTGDDDTALKVEDDTLYGASTACSMSNPVDVTDMQAVLYDMTCEADDDTFDGRAMFMKAADGGLLLIWDGYAFKYDACEEGDPGLAPAAAIAPRITPEGEE